MGISINTNVAASRAGNYLATNHSNLQKSLDRLSSGKRITEPADDAGGLAVSMKLEHTSKVLRGTTHNISNAISFLQVQDGILESAGKIVSRMGELQGMSADVTKNSTDIDNYEAEFNDLRNQLYEMTKSQFNGVNLFGDWYDNGGTQNTTGLNLGTAADLTNTNSSLNVVMAEDGTTTFTIHKALLGSALMVNNDASVTTLGMHAADTTAAAAEVIVATTATNAKNGLIQSSSDDLRTLENTGGGSTHHTAAAFTQALENIATLRATNGGQVRRLQYQLSNVETQITNIGAANGRIMDVDIAAESSNLARQQVLVQASAAMTAQANMSNDVALMLLQ
jgi:flagellin